MSEPGLYLLTPPMIDADAFAPVLAAACAAGPVAAVCIAPGEGDERVIVNRLKRLVAITQEAGAAALVAAAPAGSQSASSLDWPLIIARCGADGLHSGLTDTGGLTDLRARLDGRILGAGGLRARHDAMDAGEAGVDYVLFGEPNPDGSTPPLAAIVERAAWWAEIFEIPCVAYAPDLDAVAAITETGAEFVALGAALFDAPDPAAAMATVRERIAAGMAGLRPEPA